MAQPHGGNLVDLLVPAERAAALREQSRGWPSWDLTPRQLCDLELLLNGGFSPLRGFMGRADHDSVCRDMRLCSGALWPIPILLEVKAELAASLRAGAHLALRDAEGVMLAALTVDELWTIDREDHAQAVFGTTDRKHPGVDSLFAHDGDIAVGGRLEGLQLPSHYDFARLRHTPTALRREFAQRGWHKVVAFQTRNPMHRAHFELTLRAARDHEANLLIHPAVGMTRPGDVDHYTRVRCYEQLLPRYPRDRALLSLLPLAMRMAGPREAMLHAIVRKNYGCTHLIVGRDHAGPGHDGNGVPFYGPYEAQALLQQHADELGIGVVPFRAMVYVEDQHRYLPVDEVPAGARTQDISGTQLRDRLADGGEIPAWFTFPEVLHELRRTHPVRHRQGFTVFFTGLSGAGKSTVANVLLVKLLERGGRTVTLLDGDLVRKHLSSELGFSKEHRDINIRRIGYVAAEITRNGGIALCAPIAPYDAVRREVRTMIAGNGGFQLVYVSTPLSVCEQRDRKGLYAKARAGQIAHFTGISDPYETPTDADLVLDTTDQTPEAAAQQLIRHLEHAGFLAAPGAAS
ncbi:MAG TPA: bifunctional sulfate adenylyltransferase/adenylylsulfate kinase [Planctomycetota bacterium]|nr:bifunctional sulfate adenylyltransferase/adenylylsulfate kinase [Planctomycetota bacterium]